MKKFIHQPVLLKEVVSYLSPKKGEIFVDGTLGLGGHAKEILKKGAKLIGIDDDIEAIKRAKENLEEFDQITYVNDNFTNIREILANLQLKKVNGILLDLGVSSMQLDDPERGFSFKEDTSLDMRMNRKKGLSASDIINTYSQEKLSEIFQDYGEEEGASKIAQTIVFERQKKLIETTFELVDIIRQVMPKYRLNQKKHFATNVFRALRMEANQEIQNLVGFLSSAPDLIEKGGRLVIISFHSTEDRLVKRGFKMIKLNGKANILTKTPIVPTFSEKQVNPRARSAKLRVLEII